MKKISLVLLLLVTAISLSGCISVMNYRYPNSELYSIGDATFEASDVNKIYIDWVSGDVEVLGLSTQTQVDISEVVDAGTEDQYRMHYYLDNGTLMIRFAASITGFNHIFQVKKLIVELPEGFDKPLEVNAVSANIDISGVDSALLIDSVSGKIEVNDVVAENCLIDQVSGTITFTNVTLNDLAIDTVSGKIKSTASAFTRISLQAVSSQVELENTTTPTSCTIETVSGSIKLTLPTDASFRFEYDKVSGSVNSEFATTISGNIYTIAQGGSLYRFSTVSGSLYLYKG
ncbi:MAG: DUF4097 family beta strand repeat-containing protein [Bacilli bacterium]|nr:DUF4097 family beta strand repeat-containing protein [Bacilli bacterium]